MSRYRKKPVVISAEQWDGEWPLPDGVQLGATEEDRLHAFVETLEGRMKVSPGDFIITGVKGEKYACKPDVFALTYEPVEDA